MGLDPHGDVTVNPDGSISMTSPLEMFGLNYKFAKNGRGVGDFFLTSGLSFAISPKDIVCERKY